MEPDGQQIYVVARSVVTPLEVVEKRTADRPTLDMAGQTFPDHVVRLRLTPLSNILCLSKGSVFEVAFAVAHVNRIWRLFQP